MPPQMIKEIKGVEPQSTPEPVLHLGRHARPLFFRGPDGEKLEFFERKTSDA